MKRRVSNLLLISWISHHQNSARSFAPFSCHRNRHGVTTSRTTCTGTTGISRQIALLGTNCSKTFQDETITLAEEAFSILAKRRRTWRRLRHLVEMAQQISTNSTGKERVKSIVDIGTDHGILPIALATTAQFSQVIGVDISQTVLDGGALPLYQEVQGYISGISTGSQPSTHSKTTATCMHVEFRCGNGIAVVKPGEADIICVAGMGVNTIMKILTYSDLHRVECQHLLLQPTNCKPKNLMLLYNYLQELGWRLSDERIEKLSSRWYLSAAFSRTNGIDPHVSARALPGTMLSSIQNYDMKACFHDYIKHHSEWLSHDLSFAGVLDANEQR